MATISVILPTYNRAKFLPQAFASIQSQRFADWELIIVDDGSTDGTRNLVPSLTHGWPQQVRYNYQANQGAYGARNTGLDQATGQYLAFYDSDDVWLPHHLDDCVTALEQNPEVDWAFAACQIVDFATGQTLASNCFYEKDQPRPLLNLKTRASGRFRIFDDPSTLNCLLSHGTYCGLQNSVIRQRVFAGRRFDVRYRNEGEDVLAAIRAMAAGHQFGYFDNVHVIYHVHDQNSSAVGSGSTAARSLQVHLGILQGMEAFLSEVELPKRERRSLRRSLSQACFWRVGYALLWQQGRKREAMEMFRKALAIGPWDPWCWKTYILCWIKTLATGVGGDNRAL